MLIWWDSSRPGWSSFDACSRGIFSRGICVPLRLGSQTCNSIYMMGVARRFNPSGDWRFAVRSLPCCSPGADRRIQSRAAFWWTLKRHRLFMNIVLLNCRPGRQSTGRWQPRSAPKQGIPQFRSIRAVIAGTLFMKARSLLRGRGRQVIRFALPSHIHQLVSATVVIRFVM